MNHYLYAIVDRLPARWRPPTAGILGASVVPRRFDSVVVLGSPLDAAPPANPRTVTLHHDVVATVLDAPAVLPLPYGTVVPAPHLAEWVSARRALVAAALGAVRGCVEMTVKLLRLEGAVGARRGSGSDSDPSDALELRALAETLAERAALARWQYRPSGGPGNVTAAVAFLVPRGDVAGFLARIAPVASHARGVAVVPTGPGAPVSFVPDLSRIPTTRMLMEAAPPEQRRVG